jgi:pimeloyl-ACP methyl ester carboxylesterase
MVNWKAAAVSVLVVAALGCATFACLIRYRLDRLLFPEISGFSTAAIVATISAEPTISNRMLVRAYGTGRLGCVVFFPGQHGGVATYERTLFPLLVAQGVRVFAASYPGQDGAPGRASIAQVNILASKAVALVTSHCGSEHTIVLGRSLGTKVAAYSTGHNHVAGLILVSAAPSLSSAIDVYVRSHWYLYPFRMLRARSLLRGDYSLAQALKSSAAVPVLLFQGTQDHKTPLEPLRSEFPLPRWARIIAVPGGTHQDTYIVASGAIMAAVKSFLHRNKPNSSFEADGCAGAQLQRYRLLSFHAA